MKHVREVGSVAHQSSSLDKFTIRVGRWNLLARCQGGKLAAAIGKECVGTNEEGIGAHAGKRGKGRINIVDRRGIEDPNL
jgi:hypothetical protein